MKVPIWRMEVDVHFNYGVKIFLRGMSEDFT